MKIQHIFFLILVIFLIWKRNPRLSTATGIILLILAIPLFAKHIFFTAEAFTWYAAAFFLLAIIQNIMASSVVKLKKK